MKEYRIAVANGDGIGPEVRGATIEVVNAALKGIREFAWGSVPAGAKHYSDTGVAFPDASIEACANPVATILSGASMLEWLGVRDSDTELRDGAGG